MKICSFIHNFSIWIFFKFLYSIIYVIHFLIHIIIAQNTKIVEVTTGLVQGIIVTVPNPYQTPALSIKINAFLGIPYAESPIGIRRFQAPTPKRRWNDILFATKDSSICPQILNKFTYHYKSQISEDCLSLNIYSLHETDDRALYPVIVYFHGGSYTYGASAHWPPYKIVENKVIVVTVGYRLGVLGFFTTGDHLAPSNNGLRDQSLALEWVHANIKAFSGNPEQITIMGESAGAASVGLHMISPLSGGKGFFRSAIAMSGTEVAPWSVHTEPWEALNMSRVLAQHVGCFSRQEANGGPLSKYKFSAQTVDCLRNRSPNELTQALIHLETIYEEIIKSRLLWRPVVDGTFVMGPNVKAFLPNKPEILLRQSKFPKIPFMLGMVGNEDALLGDIYSKLYGWDEDPLPLPHQVSPFLQSKPPIDKGRQSFKKAIDDLVDLEWTGMLDKKAMSQEMNLKENYGAGLAMPTDGRGAKQLLADVMYFHYLPWADPLNRTALKIAFTQLLSDKYFTAPMDKSTKLHTDGGCTTYMYIFDYRPPLATLPQWLGTFHGTDMPFFFGIPWLSTDIFPMNYKLSDVRNWTESDRNLSSLLINLLTNFAKYGNPTPSYPLASVVPVSTFYSHQTSPANINPITFKWQPVVSSQRHYLLIYQEADTNVITDSYGISPKLEPKVLWKATMHYNYRLQFVAMWNGFVANLIGQDTGLFYENVNHDFSLFNSNYNLDRYRAATWALATVCTVLAIVLALFIFLQYKTGRDKSGLSPRSGSKSTAPTHFDHNIYVSPDELLPPIINSKPSPTASLGYSDNGENENYNSSRGSGSVNYEGSNMPPDPLTSQELEHYETNAMHSYSTTRIPKTTKSAPLYDKSQPP